MGRRPAPPASMALAARIAQARLTAGMTQVALAGAAGLDRSSVSKIESAARAVRSDELARIAAILQRPLDWFYAAPERALEDVHRHRAAIRRIGRRHGVTSIRVFGSASRDQAHAESDVDLLVEMAPERSLLDLIGFAQDVEDLLGVSTDAVTADSISPYLRDRILAAARPL